MNKQEMINLIEESLHEKIQLKDMPEIDLYMDQVIQLFEAKLSNSKRNEDDKVLTKTMINNYAKAKLLMSVKNKKYSKEHLILMSLIYELKGALSINDIKLVLSNIVNKFEAEEEYDLRGLYEKYLSECNKDNELIIKNMENKIENISDGSYEDKFLLISSVISMSNMYRRIGELLIDKYFNEEEDENEKSK